MVCDGTGEGRGLTPQPAGRTTGRATAETQEGEPRPEQAGRLCWTVRRDGASQGGKRQWHIKKREPGKGGEGASMCQRGVNHGRKSPNNAERLEESGGPQSMVTLALRSKAAPGGRDAQTEVRFPSTDAHCARHHGCKAWVTSETGLITGPGTQGGDGAGLKRKR